MAKSRNIRQASTAAVAVAGTRTKGAPVATAGAWREERGKLPEGETFRPGKTARARRR